MARLRGLITSLLIIVALSICYVLLVFDNRLYYRILYKASQNGTNANYESQQSQWIKHTVNEISSRVRSLNQLLYSNNRVLCSVLTIPSNAKAKAKQQAVMDTWGHHCHKLLFFVGSKVNSREKVEKITKLTSDGRVQLIQLAVEDGFNYTWRKVRFMIDYIRRNISTDFDWWLRADDDTFIVMPNALMFLHERNRTAPEFYGAEFKVPKHFVSTGAGLFMSQYNFGILSKAIQDNRCQNKSDGLGHDDDLKLYPANSNDEKNRTRFLTGHFRDTVRNEKERTYWLKSYPKTKLIDNRDYVSDTFIGFHYLTPDEMRELYLLLYRVRPYGFREDWQYNLE